MHLSFKYRNHHGEVAERTITFESIDWIHSPGFDYQPGWFISGMCHDRKARRSFALSHIIIEGRAFCLIKAPLPEGKAPEVKQLVFNAYPTLGNGTKLVAHDCFGSEFARLDLPAPPEFVEQFKAENQRLYEKAIRSALL